MSTTAAPTLGFVGGTGPQGRGLAARLARGGHPVVIGSRDADRAAETAEALRALAGPDAADIRGAPNADACAAGDAVVVTVPYAAQRATLEGLAQAIGGKIVVCCVNALGFDDDGPYPVRVESGSAAEECAAILRDARVASAFQSVSARKLLRVDEPITVDVLVCGDDDEAVAFTAGLVDRIDGMRPVLAGPLRLSAPIEDLTAVLVSINRRYGTNAGIRIDGIDGPPPVSGRGGS